MPIRSPDLDDLRFDGLVEEAVRRIPVYAPEWTNHNDGDPGITLIQLFAHLLEQVGYRLDRVPEKNHIELLKLLGVRLRPAHAARTRLAFTLANPATADGFALPAFSGASARDGDPPPRFETDAAIDIVPAQPVALVGTKNPLLWDVRARPPGAPDPVPSPLPDEVPPDNEWLGVVWDGDAPAYDELPVEPVAMALRPEHRYLWIALDFNRDRDAGFRGVRVALSVQLDDDEVPDLAAREQCRTPTVGAERAPAPVRWLHYYDADAGAMARVPGRIVDTTSQLTRSGDIAFDVPLSIGPIPDDGWQPFAADAPLSPLAGCAELAGALRDNLPADPSGSISLIQFTGALTTAVSVATDAAEASYAEVPHPLDPALRDARRVKGWLRVELPDAQLSAAAPKLRMVTFNMAPATNATTVTSELLGRGDGRPGQRGALAHTNALAGSLELGVQEQPDGLLETWHAVDSLDSAGPFDRQFVLDPEAGTVLFGDGRRGRIPPLVRDGGFIVAVRYQHGGGESGEVDVATVTQLETPRAGLDGVVNVVGGAGGRDAETLELAKVRARKELSTRHRAVTRGDFEWIALQTEEVRVARAHIVPLRTPLVAQVAQVPNRRCGPALPLGPLGVDTFTAHGAVSVVVVPDEDVPEPVPTRSFLRAVCRHLDRHRLVTTEVHVVPPQYLRVCGIDVAVKARPGYTRSQLQGMVAARLAEYLHALTGGDDGTGYPFGGQVHVADLTAQVFRVEGVDRVEYLAAEFTRTRTLASPRQGRLVLCADGPEEYARIDLAPDETVSVDVSELLLSTVD